MVPGFHVAAFAVEVVGDRGAGCADRLTVGVGRSRQEPVLEALEAGATGVDGVEVAGEAEPAFRPPGCESGDVSATARTRVVTSARRSRSSTRGGVRGETDRLRIHGDSWSLLVEDVRTARPHAAVERDHVRRRSDAGL